MGIWGYKPFQNDYVLNDFGGYRDSRKLINTINSRLYYKNYYFVAYELGALLCDTFKITDYTKALNKSIHIQNVLQGKDKPIGKIKELGEIEATMLCACTLSTNLRKSFLYTCRDKIKRYIDKDKEKSEFIDNIKEVYSNIVSILNNFEKYEDNAIVLPSNWMNIYNTNASTSKSTQDNSNAIRCECTSKIYSGKKVLFYSLQDTKNCIVNIEADRLKNLIRENKVYCTNLTLTSNNRLVDKYK